MNTTKQSSQQNQPLRPAYDVVVVGGGPAGLAGATTLGRARRSVLVVDAGHPRNAPAAHLHNYLSRDGVPPGDLLALGRAEVAAYGGEMVQAQVVAVERAAGGAFVVELDDGSVVGARRLLVATGLVDELPDIPGVRERWGRDVLHCPYCHGWEVRDQRIVVLATGPMAGHQALLWSQWTDDLAVVLHEGWTPSDEDLARLDARGVEVVAGPVTELEMQGDLLTGVRLEDGSLLPAAAVVVGPRFEVRSELLASLGLDPVDFRMGPHVLGTHIPSEPTGATAVDGVWVAGNVTSPTDVVITAAAAGVRVGGMINMDLVTEEADEGVAQRRAVGAETG